MVQAPAKDAHNQRLSRYSEAQHVRLALAKKRIRSVLLIHGIANHRTLEQKISDAGPFNQRINPHVLATAFEDMKRAGDLYDNSSTKGSWFHLAGTSPSIIRDRLAAQLPIWNALQASALSKRVGQSLEVAVYRALITQTTLDHVGGFRDLQAHDDRTLFSKEEPSIINGRHLPGDTRVDFVLSYGPGNWAVAEVKNTREWIYPGNTYIRDLFAKALAVDAVPILIGRRIPFVTFRILSPCGVVIHQTYNQRYPASEVDLAAQAKDKTLLGYHDIRLGNVCDTRLKKFIHQNLPRILPAARQRFINFRDLSAQYASGAYSYAEFAARVRRRQQGTNEDSDKPAEDDFELGDEL